MGNNKRCIYRAGACEEHYNSCNGLDETKCQNNIPLDPNKICKWKESSCQQDDRKCSEYIEFTYMDTNSNI